MKNITKLFVLAATITLSSLLMTCTPGLGGAVDTQPPKVTITEPLTLSTLKGDFVMKGTATDETGVKKVDIKEGTILVEGINVVTKAQKANPMAGINGGLTKIEAPMNCSKVMLYCPACEKATRIKLDTVDGKKVRICKKCGEKLDV